ncbi:MAG: hypothetical protein U0228_18545 [Myxococcaceae bacterium]
MREVRPERSELTAETGERVAFEHPRALAWDFGDRTPAVTATQVRHAFVKPGRYVVRGLDEGQLAREVTVIVGSRPCAHLVPTDADWAVLFLQPDALATATDAAERAVGPEVVQRWLERHPVQQWAFDQLEAGSAVLDPAEGLALWGWPEAPAAQVSTVGVLDETAALASLREWLLAHEWSFVSEVQGLVRYESGQRSLDVLVDRGALHAIESPYANRVPGAQARLLAAARTGLALDPEVARALDALPSGAVQTFARGQGRVHFTTGAVRVGPQSVTWEGRVIAGAPLWQALEPGERKLLAAVPDNALVVLGAAAPLEPVAELLSFAADIPPEVKQGLPGLDGQLELVVRPDVEAFVRATLSGDGLPQPRFGFRLSGGVLDEKLAVELIDALLFRWAISAAPTQSAGQTRWAGTLGDAPLELWIKGGQLGGQGGRPNAPPGQVVDYRSSPQLAPGHVMARLDLGALRRELVMPRKIEGVDPRKAITAQAAAAAVIDRLTQIDTATADLFPAPEGAGFEVTLTFNRTPVQGGP